MSESDQWHNTSWLGVARRRVESTPALLLLLPLLVGIFLSGSVNLGWGVVALVGVALVALLVVLPRGRVTHVVVLLLLVAVGYLAAQSAESRATEEALGDNALNRYAKERIERFAKSDDSYAVVEAMVVGQRERISDSLNRDYALTGFAHILAVSGLHLGIVMTLFGWLFYPLGIVHRGHRVRSVGVVVLVWLYVAMTGGSPSTMRAAVMLSVLMLARGTGMSHLPTNSILITIALLLLYDATLVDNLSFRLSVAAVLGIVLWALPLVDAIYSRRLPCRRLLSTLVVGGVASIWVLPLISYTFGNLPLMSILVTPFIMLLVYAILALGMLLLFLPDVVAEVVYGVVERVAMLHNAVVSRAADTPGFVLYATLNGYEVVAIYIGFVLFSFVVKVWSEKKYLTLLDDEPEYRLQFVDTQHPGGA